MNENRHYAELVEYDTAGFLEKNKDRLGGTECRLAQCVQRTR